MSNTDTKQQEAITFAEQAADQHGIAETVYRNKESGGWWATNALSPVLSLRGCETFVTILPRNYFA